MQYKASKSRWGHNKVSAALILSAKMTMTRHGRRAHNASALAFVTWELVTQSNSPLYLQLAQVDKTRLAQLALEISRHVLINFISDTGSRHAAGRDATVRASTAD